MNINKIIYWAATAVMCGIFFFSAYNYFTRYEIMSGYFVKLGYPTYIVYPLAVAKILGIIAILSRKSTMLKEWAYAGFFFDALLAFTAHKVAQDGAELFSIIALVSLVISRFMEPRVFTSAS